MNINVRVLSANAQAQIKALQAQVAGLQKQLAAANATSATGILAGGSAGNRSRKALGAWGNQIQWTGRQLQYNWTIPLALAAGAATKFALDNEKAFTRVQKVYGDTDAAIAWFRKNQDQIPEGMNATTAAAEAQANELEALGQAFEALSERYGVNQKEVLETAGAWAAAGASGLALAKSTEISLQAAILGDMDLAKATESLIAIQAQYSLSTEELSFALAELNVIENQTGISMQGLIDGFARSAGVAREAGVDVRHLGAMLSALVPATGTAANAGNALKTIISRLMSPTGDAADVMREFGVNTRDAAWQSSTAMERLLVLARHMDTDLKKTGQTTADTADDMYKLSDSQKQVVASVLGSRYQMNRFLVLMRELGPEVSYYERALDATADRAKVFATMQKELNAVLDSSPRRLSMIWATIQNGMANAIQPLIPYLLYLANQVAQAVNWFTELDPVVQKTALAFVVMLALVGPLTKYFGSLLTLIATMAVPFKIMLGLWIKLHTATKMVDGVLVKTHRSFTKIFLSWLAAPFKFLFSGLGLLVGYVITAAKSFIGLAVVQRGASVAAGAAVVGMQAAWAAGSAGLLAIWKVLWMTMVVIQTQGVGRLVKTWAVGLAFMMSGTARFAGITRIFSGVFLAISVLFSRQLFMPLVMGMATLSTTLGSLWIALWANLKFIMVGGQLALLSAMTTFRIVFLAGWTGLYLAMSAVPGVVYPLLVRLHMGFVAAMSSAYVVMSRVLLGIWAAMHAAMAVISMAFWGRIIKIWIAAAVALPKILIAARRAIQTAWAMIVAAQRAGALAAFAAAVGPWVALGAVIGGAIYLLRDQIRQVWNNVVAYFSDSTNEMTQAVMSAWNALPQSVANALTAVARIVRDAALAIYEWFSYINPFAEHSPSLVQNVTDGTLVISQKFAGMASAIKNHVAGAYADVKAFGTAIRKLTGGAASFEAAQDRKKIKKFAPGALQEYDQLSRRLKTLQDDLAKLDGAMQRQEQVVERYAAALEKTNNELDRQQAKLDRLVEKQQKWQEKLDEAQSRLSAFATAPLQGMGAMSDRIFENEMAQKRLRLEMMRMEEITGPLDDIASRMDAINGMQEVLRGEQANLRAAGAGSEILSKYDAEIAALEEQKKVQNDALATINDMTKALEDLERQGTILDLEQSLQFDPLTRQIDKAANAMQELPFDEVMAGVQAAQSDIDKYKEKLDEATKAVADQQLAVDNATKTRDLAQQALDREEKQLARIKEAYDEVADAISAVEGVMNDAIAAAEKMASKAEEAAKKKKAAESVSPAVQNFRDAAGGNFAQVGGAGIPVRTNWKDQSADIDAFTADMAEQTAKAFEDINPFKSFRAKWDQFKSWFMDKWSVASSAVGDMFSNAFAGVGTGGGFGKIVDKVKSMWSGFSAWMKEEIFGPAVAIWSLWWPSIREFFMKAWEGIKNVGGKIGEEFGKVWKEVKELGPAFEGLWNFMKPILALIGGGLVIVGKLVLNVAAKVIKPAIEMIGDIIAAAIQVIRGIFQFISGFFTIFSGDLEGGLKKMAAGIGNIFAGLVKAVWTIIKNGVKIIVGIFWGIVDGIIDAAKWLWDILVGHSIIPDIINAIFDWFGKLWDLVTDVYNKFVSPIVGVFTAAFDLIVAALGLWWEGMKIAWSALVTAGQWVWDNVLSPVWGFFASVWTDYIGPALAAWWENVKANWDSLKSAGQWIWDNVLKPVWDKVKALWQDYVKPGFALWWDGIKNVWDNLKKAGQWVWDNVLKPVWNWVENLWSKYVRPALAAWWENVKANWDNLKKAGQWIWDNMLSPVWTKITALWADIRKELASWWERIKIAWDGLLNVGTWIDNNFVNPIYNKITGVWTSIEGWLVRNKDILTSPIKAIVNTVITAVNAIITGLNKVADVLPGVDWEIGTIEPLAKGGPIARRANRGFKTNGARAIVGEGKANYPEFVIPTDPTYRNRARGLLAMAASKIGGYNPGVNSRKAGGDTAKDLTNAIAQGGVPQFGIGGWLSSAWEGAKGLTKDIAKLSQNAVGKVMDPALSAGRGAINKVGYVPIKSPPLYSINQLEDWVKGTDKYANTKIDDALDKVEGGPAVRAALKWARSQDSAGYKMGAVGPSLYDCSGFMAAITNHLAGFDNVHIRRGSTATFPWPGFVSGAGNGKNSFTIGSTPNYGGSGIGHMAGTLGGVNVESRGGDGVVIGASARGYADAGFSKVAHYKMKYGGIIKRRTGGTTMITGGEAGVDEAVLPLPRDWRNSGGPGGGTTNHFHGNLVFPNVKTGEDAEDFITNLENLAEG
jgi:TP901 family phage tail tape measure protein